MIVPGFYYVRTNFCGNDLLIRPTKLKIMTIIKAYWNCLKLQIAVLENIRIRESSG